MRYKISYILVSVGIDFWMGIHFYYNTTNSSAYSRRQDVGYIWDDGTLLNGTLLKLDPYEPARDQDGSIFVMWPHNINYVWTGFIEDTMPGASHSCMCQANLRPIDINY